MHNPLKLVCILLVAALPLGVSMSALAQQKDRGGTSWGPFRVLPRIDLDYIATDNYFNNKTREVATGVAIMKPGLSLEAGTPVLKYVLDADVEIGKVTRSNDDDYRDLRLSASLIYQPTSRVNLKADASYQRDHDNRGTNRTEGNPLLIRSPDKYNRTDLGGELTYGGESARGQLVLNLDYTDIGYINNRSSGTRDRDRDENGMGAIFKWRVAPKTRVTMEMRHRDFDYDSLPVSHADTTTLDSDEKRYFVGVEWAATYKTTGLFQVGRIDKDFSSSSRKDVDENAWEAGVVWRPRDYSVVNVSTGRTFGESNGTGDASLKDYLDVSWGHEWRDRFSTTLRYSYGEDEYPGSAIAAARKRVDKQTNYAVEANYKMRRWLTLGVGIEHINKNSNNKAFEYDRNNMFVSARMRF